MVGTLYGGTLNVRTLYVRTVYFRTLFVRTLCVLNFFFETVNVSPLRWGSVFTENEREKKIKMWKMFTFYGAKRAYCFLLFHFFPKVAFYCKVKEQTQRKTHFQILMISIKKVYEMSSCSVQAFFNKTRNFKTFFCFK